MDVKETEKAFKEALVKKFWRNADKQDEQRKPAENGRMQAQLRLMYELAKGRKSGEEKGWISSEEVRKYFKIRTNAK